MVASLASDGRRNHPLRRRLHGLSGTCPAYVESGQLTSVAFRSNAMALWKRSDECCLTGLWNPSIHLATAFSACWQDCQATGQISSDSMVLKTQRVNATGPSDPATPARRGQDAAFAGQGLTVHKAVLRPAVGMVNQSRSGASSQTSAAQGFDREVALQAIM